MKRTLQKVLCMALVLCSFVSTFVIGATDSPQPPTPEQNDTGVISRASHISLDTSITSAGARWIQPINYPSYRLWVDNTTGALMTVTITNPSGQTKNVYVTSGSNKTYTDNNAESGLYTLSFHTYADALSGTVRVRASNVPL